MTTLDGPHRSTTLMKCVVMFQLFISLYFISIVFAIVGSWSTSSPTRQQSLKIEELGRHTQDQK